MPDRSQPLQRLEPETKALLQKQLALGRPMQLFVAAAFVGLVALFAYLLSREQNVGLFAGAALACGVMLFANIKLARYLSNLADDVRSGFVYVGVGTVERFRRNNKQLYVRIDGTWFVCMSSRFQQQLPKGERVRYRYLAKSLLLLDAEPMAERPRAAASIEVQIRR